MLCMQNDAHIHLSRAAGDLYGFEHQVTQIPGHGWHEVPIFSPWSCSGAKATKYSHVRSMRIVKREILRLVQEFVQKSEDPDVCANLSPLCPGKWEEDQDGNFPFLMLWVTGPQGLSWKRKLCNWPLCNMPPFVRAVFQNQNFVQQKDSQTAGSKQTTVDGHVTVHS